MTMINATAALIAQALQTIPPNRAIKFVTSADYELSMIPVNADVRVWSDQDKTRAVTKTLRKKPYGFKPAGMSVVNKWNATMLPVFWGKQDQVGWIDQAEWRPVVRLAVIKDAAAGQKVGQSGSRRLEAWETVQVFEESGQYCKIGPDEWVDKDWLIFL